jgi:hypothetical protein
MRIPKIKVNTYTYVAVKLKTLWILEEVTAIMWETERQPGHEIYLPLHLQSVAAMSPPSKRRTLANVTVEDADALDCAVCYLPLKPPIFQVRSYMHPDPSSCAPTSGS